MSFNLLLYFPHFLLKKVSSRNLVRFRYTVLRLEYLIKDPVALCYVMLGGMTFLVFCFQWVSQKIRMFH